MGPLPSSCACITLICARQSMRHRLNILPLTAHSCDALAAASVPEEQWSISSKAQ